MNIIKGVLLDERERNLRMQEQYKKELAELPKGSIVGKRLKSGEYFYLARRDGGRVVFKYIGKDKSAVQKQVERRKYLEKTLKSLKEELKFIEKAVK